MVHHEDHWTRDTRSLLEKQLCWKMLEDLEEEEDDERDGGMEFMKQHA